MLKANRLPLPILRLTWSAPASAGADRPRFEPDGSDCELCYRRVNLPHAEEATAVLERDEACGVLAGGVKALGDVGPVHDVPECLDVIGLDVDVVQVEGVLPHVEHE